MIKIFTYLSMLHAKVIISLTINSDMVFRFCVKKYGINVDTGALSIKAVGTFPFGLFHFRLTDVIRLHNYMKTINP